MFLWFAQQIPFTITIYGIPSFKNIQTKIWKWRPKTLSSQKNRIYDYRRQERKIHQPIHRLWFQAAFRHRNEQGFAHQFPQLHLGQWWRHPHPRHQIPQQRGAGRRVRWPKISFRRVLRDRKSFQIHCRDAKGGAKILQGPQHLLCSGPHSRTSSQRQVGLPSGECLYRGHPRLRIPRKWVSWTELPPWNQVEGCGGQPRVLWQTDFHLFGDAQIHQDRRGIGNHGRQMDVCRAQPLTPARPSQSIARPCVQEILRTSRNCTLHSRRAKRLWGECEKLPWLHQHGGHSPP